MKRRNFLALPVIAAGVALPLPKPVFEARGELSLLALAEAGIPIPLRMWATAGNIDVDQIVDEINAENNN